MATHSSILAWTITMDRGTWWAAVREVTELDTAEHAHINTNYRSSIKLCVGKIKKKKNGPGPQEEHSIYH